MKMKYSITLVLVCLIPLFPAFSQNGSEAQGQFIQDAAYTQAIEANLDVKLLFPSMVPDRVILNLTEDPHHAVAVNWRTSTAQSGGEVEVAEATAGIGFTQNVRKIKAETERLLVTHDVNPDVEANYHAALIDGLVPGKQYVYRVGYGAYWSEWFQISLPDPGDKLHFFYYGDAQNGVKAHWSRLVREAYKKFPEISFMLHAGDLINRHNNDHEWGEWFHAGGYIHAAVPSMMTPGNHEFGREMDFSPQWRPQFNLPLNGPKDLEETCYQVNFPQVKLISLNSQ